MKLVPSRLALCLGIALLGQFCEASVVQRMTLREQIDNADLIFVGTSVRHEVAPSKNGKIPFTFVTFSVEEVIKGATESGQMTLRMIGGPLGSRRLRIDGMPEFEDGSKYLLFVSQNGVAGCPILGWGQGVFQFVKDSRSGQTLIEDEHGAALAGIDGDEWVRGAAKYQPRKGLVYSQPLSGTIAHDSPNDLNGGVVVPQSKVDRTVPLKSELVLARLRTLVASRKNAPEFRSSAVPTRSANIWEVPVGLGGSASVTPVGRQ